MFRYLAFAFLLLTQTGAAHAGAWPRDRGTGFASASVHLSWPQDIATWTSTAPTQGYRTLYVEYGLTDRLTLGLDLGRAVSGEGKSVLFLQLPLRDRDSGLRVAAELGLGRIAGEPVFRPGLSVGRGLETGWLAVDTVAEFGLESGKTGIKTDVTWGRRLARDRKLLLQLQAGLSANDPYFLRFAPSLVVPVSKRLSLETGATWGLVGDSSMGLKLGMWSTF